MKKISMLDSKEAKGTFFIEFLVYNKKNAMQILLFIVRNWQVCYNKQVIEWTDEEESGQ